MTDGDKKIVPLHSAAPDTSPEERAPRLMVEVERLARLPPVEGMFYIESDGYADKYGINKTTLKRMVDAVIKDREKQAREAKADDRREKQRVERKQERTDRLSRQDRERSQKEAERARKEAERRARARGAAEKA